MTDTVAREQSAEQRLDELRERVARCRVRTQELLDRATVTSERSAQMRGELRGCNHAGEVEQLRVELGKVQDELDGLRTAMATRAVIEQAKGMIMSLERCSADRAFDLLVAMSQRTHRKLHDVASSIVVAASQRPETAGSASARG